MSYEQLEKKMRDTYNQTARRYRADDEQESRTREHCRNCAILRDVCASFDRPINVLEVGCGTGRYFHCLQNVKKLVGLDVAEAMLEEARHPLKAREISIPETELIVGNAYTHSFTPASFDFIYSLGVFGNGCAVTVDLCNKFHDWLSPDGCLYFDAIDTSGEPLKWKLRKRAKAMVYSMLPRSLRQAWDEKTGWLPFFMATEGGLTRLLEKTRFAHSSVTKTPCRLTEGPGAKLECVAVKKNHPNLAKNSNHAGSKISSASRETNVGLPTWNQSHLPGKQ